MNGWMDGLADSRMVGYIACMDGWMDVLTNLYGRMDEWIGGLI